MSTSAILGDFSQLPMNVGYGTGPDTAQNPLPTSPTPAPVLPPFPQPPVFPSIPSSENPSQPNPTYPSHPQPDSIQPQYLTDFTCMIGILTDNQIAFQQGIMQVLGQPQSAAPLLGSSVKVRNPRMFSGKHKEVTPFLGEVNHIIQFNSVSFPTNNHKVLFLALYLKDGIPVEWFNNLENHSSPLLHNWSTFLAEFRRKFSNPSLVQSAKYKLDQFVQTSSAHSYLTHFIDISSHLDLTKQMKISCLMKGLKPVIKDNLVSIINRPQTLHGWENIIIQVDTNIHQHEIERQEESGKKPPKPSPSDPSPTPILTPINSNVIPMEVNALQAPPGPHGKLTQAELDYRIKNNLCLHCGNPPLQGNVQPE